MVVIAIAVAVALNTVVPAALVVTLANAAEPPTLPRKAVAPLVLIVRPYAPLTVLLNVIAPLDELVSVVAAPKVTAPV